MQNVIKVTLAVVVFIGSTLIDEYMSSPLGAPLARCGNMRPGHPFEPQTEPSPYQITYSLVDPKNTNNTSIKFHVTIDSDEHRLFKGLLLMARYELHNEEAIGTWETSIKNTRTNKCFGIDNVIYNSLR